MSGAVAPKLLERNPVSSKVSIFRACCASLHQEYHQILPHPFQLALSKQEAAPQHSAGFNPCFFLRAALSLPAQAQTGCSSPNEELYLRKVHAREVQKKTFSTSPRQFTRFDLGCLYHTCMLVSIDVDARTQSRLKMLAKRSAHGVCSHASCAHGRWLSPGREFMYPYIHNNATTMPQYRVMTCCRRCSRVALAGVDLFWSTEAMGSCKL